MSALRSLVVPLLLSLGPGAFLCACKSEEPYETGATAGKSVREAADEADRASASLDATIHSLTDLVEKPGLEPARQFRTFSTAHVDLETHAIGVRELAAEIDKNSAAYFSQWDTQIAAISNEDIRGRSRERRETVEKSFAGIREKYAKAREGLVPLLSDLKDIRAALAADLTAPGIEAVRKQANQVAKRSKDVKEALTELSSEYRELGVGIASAAPPPAPPKE